MCVDGVGDAGDLMAFEQGTGLGLGLKPTATRHKVDVLTLKHTELTLPDGGGEVVAIFVTQQTAVATAGDETTASEGDMTNRCCRPDVVHGPYYGLA